MTGSYYGTPKTVGELRKVLSTFKDDCPLMVRNGQFPNVGYCWIDHQGFCEIEIQQVDRISP